MKVFIAAAYLVFYSADVFSQSPPDTFETKYCSGCHAVDKKMVGPALKDVAVKYENKVDAVDYLTQKLIKGGVGVWGKVAMPANEALSEVDAKILAVWILKLK